MITIKKVKIVWFEDVFGWNMTGIIGPDNKWFFGYSQRLYEAHNNKDLIELLKQASKTDNSV